MKYWINRGISWIAYRTTKRYTTIKIRSLEPNYWDKDTLLLHGIMQLVVDYVEIECSQMHRRVKPSLRDRLLRMIPWFLRSDEWYRSPESGVADLKWQCSLDDSSLPEDERNPEQAQAARVILEVYTWWKDIYPKREDPHLNPDYYTKDLLKIIRQHSKEDAKMLKKIIDVREYLWT